ncbi:MAG: S1 RNA-binding domain-containing protein [Candidatus Bipolaricaulota bacterium]|nr:S1 RNA-binding domain-containing protein [Candidatus Bipolaricaulota bacterium]MCX7844253.1 S1 RNA-binding domain-containing protein [Candidatus Bipolaricaulota bacterium]MDW8151873.1 S1 RNA-binding domain-containing protein [Candidatus Bipolaricaulota bacterium]
MAERYRVGDLVWARVLEILPNGALLYLDEETQGFLHLSEIAEEPGNRVEERLQEGMELLVKVIGYDRLGRPTVSLRRVTDLDREMAEFHREALEVRALLSQRAVNVAEPVRTEERLEWRLGRWLAEAEAALTALRRRRNERLSRALGE